MIQIKIKIGETSKIESKLHLHEKEKKKQLV